MIKFFKKFFHRFGGDKKKYKPHATDPDNPPAIYWPEVQQFLDSFRHIIEENTLEDEQYQAVNEQVLNYLEHQIEIKGSFGTQQEKAHALEILADRVLTTTMSKFVGLKPQTTIKTAYSDIVHSFKKDLQNRKEKAH